MEFIKNIQAMQKYCAGIGIPAATNVTGYAVILAIFMGLWVLTGIWMEFFLGMAFVGVVWLLGILSSIRLGGILRKEGEEKMVEAMMGSANWKEEINKGTYKWKIL